MKFVPKYDGSYAGQCYHDCSTHRVEVEVLQAHYSDLIVDITHPYSLVSDLLNSADRVADSEFWYSLPFSFNFSEPPIKGHTMTP